MRNKILTIAALSTLVAGPVFAQSTAPTPSTEAAPPAVSSPSSEMKSGTSAPTTSATFIDNQSQEQWLATDLIGTKVSGASDEKLGEVNDVLLDRNGNVIGAVIGVGGFLGVGEKDVAVPFNTLELVRNSDGDKLILRKSKDELKGAPDFKEYSRPMPAAGGSASGPMTSPPAAAR